MRLNRTLLAAAAALVSACLLAGCAPHTRVLCEPLELTYLGDPWAAVEAIDGTKLAESDRDRFLYHAQRGHLLHLAGGFEESNRELEAAVAIAEDLEPWSVTETLTDYTLNEAVKAYAGEDYERAYLHYYMALNYLEMDDFEGALVECRRLDEVFRELDARYGEDGRYQEDGFIRYLSGLIYESMGLPDDARVDYRLAVGAYGRPLPLVYGGAMGPAPGDTVAVATPRGLERSLARLEGPDSSLPTESRRGETEIVVAIDSGWAPFKVEESVEVPIHRSLVPDGLRGRTNLAALVKIAYPVFVSPSGAGVPFRAGTVDASGRFTVSRPAELAQDVDAVARAVLARRTPALILRSTLRATAKQVALARAKHEREEDRDGDSDEEPLAFLEKEEGGIWSAIFGWLFENMATYAVAETEQADTRSWVLLPSEIWLARIPVEPGEHEVVVQALDGSERFSLGVVTVPPGGKVFRSARFFGAPHPVRCDD